MKLPPPTLLSYIRDGNLYADKNGVLYPAIDVFWQYQKMIQENQNMIDLLQSIIDNR